MEEKKGLLIIDPPSELRFVGPFSRPVVTIMRLTNPTENSILFKIKTTAPKRYCVRPNFGAVLPNSQSSVEICLQAFSYDANEKNKHKFMVQSLVAPEDCADPNKVWREAELDQMMDAKLKCVFEMPATSANADTSGSAPVASGALRENFTKSSGEEKLSNIQATSEDTEEVIAEMKQLREKNMGLRQEVINLKEQIVRLRSAPAMSAKTIDETYAPMIAEKQIPVFYIAISIAAAIFGILLGKYLL
ncbi:vesicle-associated membrane protein-associated protein A [Teleopsis dalmanni]|uniref:vesicle-associated membrane protein-associated protein A n=1 Tax=Teleopsis dalmanni TaxID=139649 RepID=UPI0018CEC187|nr:vesicle-associated membrane protein-associated protein A [Teleopsis dalmanni]XP_037938253.1 vesicle-associated membrane protein-associated protein A [Teleopsis dalmanni]